MMPIPEILKFIIAMIIMMNPLGSLSIFLDQTRRIDKDEQKRISRQILVAMLVIMLITIWSGEALLNIFGITVASFRCAGGLILLLMGLSMLHAKESPFSHSADEDRLTKDRSSIAIVPMTLPTIIGPGAISTLIITTGDYPSLMTNLSISFICAGLAFGMFIILYYATTVADFVGIAVMNVISRIMGMIIMAIAVGMLADGIHGLFIIQPLT